MKITHILAITATSTILAGCLSTQTQIEGAAPALAGTGAKHIHNVEGHGDFMHSHSGNSTAQHTHSWAEIQKQIKGQ